MSDRDYKTLLDAEALASKQGQQAMAQAIRKWLDEIENEQRPAMAKPF